MLYLFIYLADRVAGLHHALGMICLASFVIITGVLLISFMFLSEPQLTEGKAGKISSFMRSWFKGYWIPTSCILLSSLIPSSTAMYAIAGVYLGEKVIETEAVSQELPAILNKSIQLINTKLDEAISESLEVSKGE